MFIEWQWIVHCIENFTHFNCNWQQNQWQITSITIKLLPEVCTCEILQMAIMARIKIVKTMKCALFHFDKNLLTFIGNCFTNGLRCFEKMFTAKLFWKYFNVFILRFIIKCNWRGNIVGLYQNCSAVSYLTVRYLKSYSGISNLLLKFFSL